MSDFPCRALDCAAAARCLRCGGVVIFPTETFYGLGCLAADAAAVARVYQLKRRPVQRPLPLLAADADQAGAVVWLDAAPPGLTARFWPGPLSLLLPARPGLPAPLVRSGAGGADRAAGKAALRVSPHPLAARLARLAGGALTASSANLSGRAPACCLEDLDPELLAALAELGDLGGLLPAVSEAEQPSGGAPSTLAEPLPPDGDGRPRLRLLRVGAVSVRDLAEAGFVCVD